MTNDKTGQMPDYRGNKVTSRDGAETGEVTGTRPCQLEGCRGVRLRVRWPDGKVTFPCTKGMIFDGNDHWRLL